MKKKVSKMNVRDKQQVVSNWDDGDRTSTELEMDFESIQDLFMVLPPKRRALKLLNQ
jgi:predicted transcriptional regulator